MEKKEMIRIAVWCDMKGIRDHETLKYSDEMYGNEQWSYDVWQYFEEMKEIGRVSFKEKYAELIN